MDRDVNQEVTARDKHKKTNLTKKRAGRDPKLYTGKIFLETSTKLKAAFKPYFESEYRQLYLTEALKDIGMGIYSLPKCENYTQNVISTLCIKFVFGKCSYRTRYNFKNIPGR